MKLPPLTVIEASAGTGKTYTLVTRLLQLIFNGTPPERIVALTFSRMAAGEIFNSFIERLSTAAGDAETAAKACFAVLHFSGGRTEFDDFGFFQKTERGHFPAALVIDRHIRQLYDESCAYDPIGIGTWRGTHNYERISFSRGTHAHRR